MMVSRRHRFMLPKTMDFILLQADALSLRDSCGKIIAVRIASFTGHLRLMNVVTFSPSDLCKFSAFLQ